MADHIFDYGDRSPFAAVVDLDSFADPIWKNHTAASATPDVREFG